jgi:vancomycin resistance protein YoaR
VNGRVSAFQSSKDGQIIDQDASLNSIETNLIEQKKNEIELTVKKMVSDASATTTDNLGITQILGTGHSNFSGSPKNRRQNIKNGAKNLSGLLIKPGETFSVVSNLGSIDAAGGYLPELVIKGNKTTPEYGGGLCQVGTTMFRAALDSGLPIVERRNHSYRVGYYEPAGTDATVYDPSPDLKFLNDTGNYILIQSRITGNDIYFDFWGTSDGRVATRTYPTIYNIVKPKPAKTIETTTLKPGEKKCTEKAHNGADAFFDYTVTYANGDVKKKKFSSHYVPWQEVCLIGVKTLTASSSPGSTATSTPIADNKTTPIATSTKN